MFSEEVTTVLLVFDIAILGLFLIEVSLKIFAFRAKYLLNCLNFFDAIIVVVSLVLSLLDLLMGDDSSEGLDKLGRIRPILRLLRIVIIFRKLSNVSGIA